MNFDILATVDQRGYVLSGIQESQVAIHDLTRNGRNRESGSRASLYQSGPICLIRMNVVIMGRRHWQALKNPYVGRLNVVITKKPNASMRERADSIFSGLDDALAWAFDTIDPSYRVFVIGGRRLYEKAVGNQWLSYIHFFRIPVAGEGVEFPAHDSRRVIETLIKAADETVVNPMVNPKSEQETD